MLVIWPHSHDFFLFFSFFLIKLFLVLQKRLEIIDFVIYYIDYYLFDKMDNNVALAGTVHICKIVCVESEFTNHSLSYHYGCYKLFMVKLSKVFIMEGGGKSPPPLNNMLQIEVIIPAPSPTPRSHLQFFSFFSIAKYSRVI